MVKRISYSVANAFSSDSFGGNPAAIVFAQDEELSTDVLEKLSTTLNQPILSAVSKQLPSSDLKIARFGIRWFTPLPQEIYLCGHGTIAASKAIFNRAGMVSDEVERLEFVTEKNGVISAEKVEDGRLEIRLQGGSFVEICGEERQKLVGILARAFGRPVDVKTIIAGTGYMNIYVMFEIDAKEDLAGSTLNAEPLKETGYFINTITTESLDGEATFLSRTFIPRVYPGPGEDHVCGSAHCLSAPYWYQKKGLKKGEAAISAVVSARGGTVHLVWEEDNTLRLSGQAVVFSAGELFLQ